MSGISLDDMRNGLIPRPTRSVLSGQEITVEYREAMENGETFWVLEEEGGEPHSIAVMDDIGQIRFGPADSPQIMTADGQPGTPMTEEEIAGLEAAEAGPPPELDGLPPELAQMLQQLISGGDLGPCEDPDCGCKDDE